MTDSIKPKWRERVSLHVDDVASTIDNCYAVKTLSGQWFIQFELDGEIQIDDDRSVILKRSISLRGEQQGRKPRTVKAKTEKGVKGFQKQK